MKFFSRQKPLVGLDIGSSSVKAVELRKMKSGYELLHVGLEPLASDTVVDGAIMDALSVSDSITKIFSERKIKTTLSKPTGSDFTALRSKFLALEFHPFVENCFLKAPAVS